MRWPFSIFNRSPKPDSPDSGDAPDGAAEGTAASGPEPSPAAGPTSAAWRNLPAVQRASGPPPLTAPALPFARALGGRHGPEPTLAPLAHDVARDGTAGLVSGVAVPLAHAAPSIGAAGAGSGAHGWTASLPVSGGAHWPVAQREFGRASVAALPVQREVAAPPAPDPVDVPAPMPPRNLPVAAAPAAALDATHVAPASAPAPVRPTAPVVARLVDGGSALGDAIPDVGQAGDPGPQAAKLRPAEPASSVGVTAPPVGFATGDAIVAESTAQGGHRTLGESRRLGLGAPLGGRPVAQRLGLDAPALPLAGPIRTEAMAPPAPPTRPPAAATTAVIPAAGAAAPLPVLRSIDPTFAVRAAADAAGRAPDAPSASAAAASGPAPADLPLASYPGRRPADLASIARDGGRRAADDRVADAAGAGDASGMPEAEDPPAAAAPEALRPASGAGPRDGDQFVDLPVVARRLVGEAASEAADTADAAPPALPVPSAAAGTVRGSAAVSTTAGPGDRSAGRAFPGASAPAALPIASARPTIQRSAGPLLPVLRPSSSDGAGTAGGASSAGAAGLHGPAVPARPRGAATSDAADSDPTTSWPAVPRAAVAGGDGPPAASTATWLAGPSSVPAAMPVVARQAVQVSEAGAPLAPRGPSAGGPSPSSVAWGSADGEIPAAFADAWSAPGGPSGSGLAQVQRAVQIDEMTVRASPGAAASPSGAAGGAAGQDLESLADDLYPKVRDRLAKDLLIERERAGLLVDW